MKAVAHFVSRFRTRHVRQLDGLVLWRACHHSCRVTTDFARFDHASRLGWGTALPIALKSYRHLLVGRTKSVTQH
jgi:hypothetical protein